MVCIFWRSQCHGRYIGQPLGVGSEKGPRLCGDGLVSTIFFSVGTAAISEVGKFNVDVVFKVPRDGGRLRSPDHMVMDAEVPGGFRTSMILLPLFIRLAFGGTWSS